VNNPYAAPRAKVEDVEDPQDKVEYAGFWVRVAAISSPLRGRCFPRSFRQEACGPVL